MSNYKFSKFFAPIQHPWNSLGVFEILSLPHKAWFHKNFQQKYSFIRQTQCLKNFSKFWVFLKKGHTQKLTVFVRFCTIFTSGKLKILAKFKNVLKNYIFRTIKYLTSRSHTNQRILIKLTKERPFWGPKNDLNCPLTLAQMVNTNSHIGYNKTIYPWFLDP